jgi:hypothetical protein
MHLAKVAEECQLYPTVRSLIRKLSLRVTPGGQYNSYKLLAHEVGADRALNKGQFPQTSDQELQVVSWVEYLTKCRGLQHDNDYPPVALSRFVLPPYQLPKGSDTPEVCHKLGKKPCRSHLGEIHN